MPRLPAQRVPPTFPGASALGVSLAFLLASCGANPPRVTAPTVSTASRELRGTVRYEARTPTGTGASERLETRPSRAVPVVFLDGQGRERARVTTDESGAFVATIPVEVSSLRIDTTTTGEGFDLSISPDGRGRGVYAISRPIAPDATTIDVVALEAGASGESGALHILDTLLTGARAVHAWTGRDLPALYTYWGRGVTSTWSYYHGERPKGSGRYALELLGGARDAQATSDTDEHDEMIVLHEFGHFVFDRLSSDSSHGGDHPGGTMLDPGLAWEEARATWFAAVVLRAPRYRDTVGLEPNGRLRVDEDLERRAPGPVGYGSESTVTEVLWDLVDGSAGIPDGDDDGVALEPGVVLRAMIDVAADEGAYPCLPTFLSYLAERGIVDRASLAEMLGRGGHPASLVPASGEVPWPIPLTVGRRVSGKIDGLTDPAPSGGPARSTNGFDAVRTYRLHVEERGFLEVELTVLGTGRARDHQDADLELRSIRSVTLGSVHGEDRVERIGHFVEPGYYIVIVHDGGGGNRVGFQLLATLEAAGAEEASRALDPPESLPPHSAP